MLDLVSIFQGLEAGEIPLYSEPPETFTDVTFPRYDKPHAGPVRQVSVDEYLATRRQKAR